MFTYTKHATYKFRRKGIKNLEIGKEDVESVVLEPKAVDETKHPPLAVAPITRDLSLCVVYKKEKGSFNIITFFPARRGRYESKILQKR